MNTNIVTIVNDTTGTCSVVVDGRKCGEPSTFRITSPVFNQYTCMGHTAVVIRDANKITHRTPNCNTSDDEPIYCNGCGLPPTRHTPDCPFVK